LSCGNEQQEEAQGQRNEADSGTQNLEENEELVHDREGHLEVEHEELVVSEESPYAVRDLISPGLRCFWVHFDVEI